MSCLVMMMVKDDSLFLLGFLFSFAKYLRKGRQDIFGMIVDRRMIRNGSWFIENGESVFGILK